MDITRRLAPYLDRHLVLPLIDFLLEKELYPEKDLLAAKLQLLSKTNMIDYYCEIHKKLHGTDAPAEVTNRRKEVVEKLRSLGTEIQTFIRTFLQAGETLLLQQLQEQNNFTLEYLDKTYGITEETLTAMYKYAKTQYEVGAYAHASQFLYFYRALSKAKLYDSSAMWGTFAADILVHYFEKALEDMKSIQDSIPLLMSAAGGKGDPQLQARVSLIHWSLFVFFAQKLPDGRDLMLDLYFEERSGQGQRTQWMGTKYLEALQTACPHVLRYLTVAVIVNTKKRYVMKELIELLARAIEQENKTYSDPITQFVEKLCSQFDFEGAQKSLDECAEVLSNDFFLHAFKDEFMDKARLLEFEYYCRIHSVVDIGMVASRLNMSHEQAEVWIVNLIRNARLEARIDSQQSRVLLASQQVDIYQSIKNKTSGINSRTLQLWRAASSLMTQAQQAPAQ